MTGLADLEFEAGVPRGPDVSTANE